jgi:hypothetical protein
MKAKASAASRSILQDFLGSMKALAWLELECVYSIPIWLKTRKEVLLAFHGFHLKTGVFQITFCFCPKSSLVRLCKTGCDNFYPPAWAPTSPMQKFEIEISQKALNWTEQTQFLT